MALSRVCLDTSAYSRFRKGEGPVTRILDEAEWVGVPAVVLGELRASFLRGGRSRENLDRLEEFLAHPVVDEIPIDGVVAEHYAEIWNDLRRLGTPVPTNDVWIASCAARTAGTVLTYDAHFGQILRIGVLVLKPEEPED